MSGVDQDDRQATWGPATGWEQFERVSGRGALKRQQPLPVTEGALQLLEKANREGLGHQDVSAVYLALSRRKELLRA